MTILKELQFIIDNIPSYIFWKDRNSIYHGCNTAFAHSAGLDSPEDIVGKTDFDLPWTHEESVFYRKVDKEVIDLGVKQLDIEEPQTIDGSVRWLSTNKIPLYNDTNEIVGILGTYEDITKRKNLELALAAQAKKMEKKNIELEDLNRSLSLKNKQLEELTYITSHDLQEPIRAINTLTKYLVNNNKNKFDTRTSQSLQFLEESSDRMSELVKGLMDYAKIGRIAEPELVDCNEIVNNVLKDLSLTIEDLSASFEIGHLPVLTAHKTEIRLLFQNLISNSLKFRKKQEKPKIEISVCADNDAYKFSVKDNGIGFEAKNINRIFQMFQRLHKREEYGGTGIGLAHCKRIVELHKGEIWAESIFGKGSTFYFTLQKI